VLIQTILITDWASGLQLNPSNYKAYKNEETQFFFTANDVTSIYQLVLTFRGDKRMFVYNWDSSTKVLTYQCQFLSTYPLFGAADNLNYSNNQYLYHFDKQNTLSASRTLKADGAGVPSGVVTDTYLNDQTSTSLKIEKF
jgi:hypothetical protein